MLCPAHEKFRGSFIFKESGISEIIIGYKNDLEKAEIKDLKLEIFDLQFDLRMLHLTSEEINRELFKYNDILVEFDHNRFNIHNAYHKIDEIKHELKMRSKIHMLNRRLLDLENKIS